MPNLAVTARFNESKHQMFTEQTADLTPLATITNVRMGIAIKEWQLGTATHLNQVELKSAVDRLLHRVGKVLESVTEAAYPFGALIHAPIDQIADGNSVITVMADADWYAALGNGEVGIFIPSAAGWVKDGSSVQLLTIGTRMHEKLSEDFLKGV